MSLPACRNGGVGQRVLDVGLASNSQAEVLEWMLKPGAAKPPSRRTTSERSISGGGSGSGSTSAGSGSSRRVSGAGALGGIGLAAPGALRAPTGSFKRA